jgi:hypothetical protein
MHGMPLGWARFERKNVPSLGWRVVITGQNEFVRGTYAESGDTGQLTFAEAGWYLLVVQTETARKTTEIELIQPTTDAINTLGRWNMATFVQPTVVTAGASGVADPTVTLLTRSWQPFERVSMAWILQTTTANQAVKWRASSGQTVGSQTWTADVWRFHNYAAGVEGQKTQDSNRLLAEVTQGNNTGGNATVSALTTLKNAYLNPEPIWHRIGATADNAANRVSFYPRDMLANYTHDVIFTIKTTPGQTATGTPTLTVFNNVGGSMGTVSIPYNATAATYTLSIAAGSNRINEIRISNFGVADKFDVWGRCNVTN